MRFRSRRGQGYAEYAFIVLLIAVFVIATLEAFGYDVADFYDETAYNVQLVADGRGDEARGTSLYSYTPPSHGDPGGGPD